VEHCLGAFHPFSRRVDVINSVTPLLLPMRGLLNRDRKVAHGRLISALSIYPWLYRNLRQPAERLYASLEILLSLMLFIGTTLYVRFAGQQR